MKGQGLFLLEVWFGPKNAFFYLEMSEKKMSFYKVVVNIILRTYVIIKLFHLNPFNPIFVKNKL